MQKSRFKKMSFEDKFDRKYACWTFNHDGWKKANVIFHAKHKKCEKPYKSVNSMKNLDI